MGASSDTEPSDGGERRGTHEGTERAAPTPIIGRRAAASRGGGADTQRRRGALKDAK